MTRNKKRVGIWCAYHETLRANAGIGVFAHSLALSLALQDNCSGVDLVCLPGDEHLLQETIAKSGGKIRAVPLAEQSTVARKTSKLRRSIEKRWKRLRAKVVGTPRKHSLAGSQRVGEQKIVEACDAWVVPYVLLDKQFSKPTVVTIHDMVCAHFPEMLERDHLASVMTLAKAVADQSTICACMSEFIERVDLRGVLGIPAEKTRVVQPWLPHDFQDQSLSSERDEGTSAFSFLGEEYFFYPSGFRHYKNHRVLIEAIATIKNQYGATPNVVFTGEAEMPSELQTIAQELGVQEQVKHVGRVSRAELAQLYQNATATVVPSLYEQGSYPLLEALCWECPIASSNIESLRERFDVLGDSMQYFDPHDSVSVAECLLNLAANRNSIRDSQQSRKSVIFSRSAHDAGKDWMNVILEAITKDALAKQTPKAA